MIPRPIRTNRPRRLPCRIKSRSTEGPKEDEEPLALEFLEPSSKPGSLGRLGHHEVLEVLGRGGFGIVVRAFDESLHRMVAIKVLVAATGVHLTGAQALSARGPRLRPRPARQRRPDLCRRGAAAALPGHGVHPGPDLATEARRSPARWTWRTYSASEAQIARGLAAAHEQGLIHRDIKPGNILLESGIEQNVKITDFGLARAADDASLSQSGVIAGTPLYMAPEQAKGEPPDPRADLFSLGSVLYTMASGRPPFRATTPLAVLKRVAEDTPRPIRQIIPEVPQWLCDLIARLHAKDPAHRFQSAAEVAALLEQHLAHLQQPSLVARPQAVKVPAPARCRAGRRFWRRRLSCSASWAR